jgi:RNA polymerase sigma factor (TIGR02999 family)
MLGDDDPPDVTERDAKASPPSPGDVTRLLSGAARGNRQDTDRLLPLVYEELHLLARRELRTERKDHTLQATALVHEAYLRLLGVDEVDWRDRAQFFGFASHLVRRILVEHARARSRRKRGGALRRVTLSPDLRASGGPEEIDLLGLDASLDRLAEKAPDAARVVEMKFFAGLSSDDIAAVLRTSKRTVERLWKSARAWLYRDAVRTTG